MRNRLAVLTAIMALPIASAHGQDMAGPKNVLSIQPLSAMLTVYSAEWEHAAKKQVSFGVGATYWNAGDAGDGVKYLSGDFKVRYYPMGMALHGFSFGGSVGFTSVTGTSSGGGDETASGATLGVLLEYQWLLGEKKNFAIALGAGAKTLFVSDDNITSSDFTAHYPTARISIGYAY